MSYNNAFELVLAYAMTRSSPFMLMAVSDASVSKINLSWAFGKVNTGVVGSPCFKVSNAWSCS